MVYKPNSVPLVGRRSLIWDRRYRLPQATYPEPTRTIWADSSKRTSPAMMLFDPPTLDGGILRRINARRASASIPYLVLHPVGFAMPAMSPWPRCAFTAPFHPCHSDGIGIRRYVLCGTFPHWHCRQCQRVGITHHRALRCSDFPPGFHRATARPFHLSIITYAGELFPGGLDDHALRSDVYGFTVGHDSYPEDAGNMFFSVAS